MYIVFYNILIVYPQFRYEKATLGMSPTLFFKFYLALSIRFQHKADLSLSVHLSSSS